LNASISIIGLSLICRIFRKIHCYSPIISAKIDNSCAT
jgi:hypothetical protein